MEFKANGFLVCILVILTFSTIAIHAGILESLDKELTDLVDRAEPFLVTVEAENYNQDRMLVGSGVLLNKDGYIVTTSSVVNKDSDVIVKFKNDNSYPAQVIGIDRQSGIALLKIEPLDHKLPVFGDSQAIKEGSWITVIGNSYDIPNSVNFGVFSGVTENGLLQLSVQSSPGSSGGAVFNTKGEVIGILVAQTLETVSLSFADDEKKLKRVAPDYNVFSKIYPDYSRTFGIDLPSSSTNLAVPIDRVNKIVEQLKQYGKVKRGFLGIKQKKLNQALLKKHDLETGVLIAEVSEGSPADKAGLQEDDIIKKLDGTAVRNPGHLYALVRSQSPGDEIKLDIIRDNAPLTITVVLGEAPDDLLYGFYDYPGFFPFDKSTWTVFGNKLKDQIGGYKKSLNDFKDDDADYGELEQKLKELDLRLKELNDKIDDLSEKIQAK